ncbi:MAG: response regulator [Spirochaetia bacterium]|nr:response regulator [Spirochaetia bacterium]
MNILVVEDDIITGEYIKKILTVLKYVIFAANSAESALKIIEEQKLNLIITDIFLPGESGIELCRKINKNPDKPYIIAITAQEDDKILSQVLEAGADDFMAKPFSVELFKTRLKIAEKNINKNNKIITTQGELWDNEEKLKSMVDKLAAANKELENYAYIVSHDLKAPLRSINTLADWLREDYAENIDTKGREKLSEIQNKAIKMHDLIEGILYYSKARPSSGDSSAVELDKVIEDVKSLLSVSENIEIIRETSMPVIEFEKTKAEQIFLNLFNKAVSLNESEKIVIKTGVIKDEKWLQFYINYKTNIPGEKIFNEHPEVFTVFKNELDDEYSIVKKIIHSYKGEIWHKTKKENDMTFYFTLPKALEIEAVYG